MRKYLKAALFLLAAGIIFTAYYLRQEPSFDLCPFCDTKIIQRQKFYEDTLSLALYSYKPILEGHCLIVPKRHVERYEDLTLEEMTSLQQLIQRTHKAVSKALGTRSYILLQKNGASVGQTVPHVHIHYIPREEHNSSILGLFFRFFINPIKSPISPEEMHDKTSAIASSF